MTYDEAVYAADEFTLTTGMEAFVYWDDDRIGGYDWCSEDEYYYGSCQWVYSHEIVYSTYGGRYG